MVLRANGNHTNFDPYLLQCMMDERYTDIFKILRCYCKKKSSPELHRLKDSSQSTLLHHAAGYGNSKIVKYLLDYKCDIDAQDNLGMTPILLAVTGGHEIVFEKLLKANANIRLRDSQGRNVLHMIFEFDFKRLVMLGMLFRQITWEKIIEGITLDDLAKKLKEFDCPAKNILEWGNIELLKFALHRQIIKIDVRDHNTGDTLLHKAVHMKNLQLSRILIEYGVDVDAMDRWMATPLFYLCVGHYINNESAEFLETLKVFVKSATSLTSSNVHGFMQICSALQYGSSNVVEIILNSNVNLYITDKKGNTVLHYLAQNRNIDLFKLMRGRIFNVNLKNNDQCTPLQIAAQLNSFEVIHFFLKNGANIFEGNDPIKTPLYLIFNRYNMMNKRTVEILLQCCINFQVYNDFTSTLLNSIVVRSTSVTALEANLGIVDHSVRAEPVLCRLAVFQEIGNNIDQFICEMIKQRPAWSTYFEMCQCEVKRMRELTIYGKITMLDFLTEEKKKIIGYVRNEEFVCEFEKTINQKFEFDSPYPELLRSYLEKVIHLNELKNKAVTAFCRLIDSKNNFHSIAAEFVIEYLVIQDMDNLHLALTEKVEL